jgi:zinc/manganese transport system substrate-binding protein
MTTLLMSLLAAATLAGGTPTDPPVKVVTSLTTYAAIAREVAGDRATVTSIAEGDEDPHFVQPRPSFVPLLRSADLFVTTGMDLELWVPTLLDRAGNPRIRENGPGYVAAFQGVHILEIPTSLSRAEGDIHVDGNPHIHTDPINAIIIARNILAGLRRVSPANGDYFAGREQDFELRVLKALVGDDIVSVLTPAGVFRLAQHDSLMSFLQRPFQGQPLVNRLGGWLRQAMPFRGKDMVCYHKEWAYFSNRYGVNCVEYIEAKPGIPPTPRHVQDVIALMRDRHIPVLFSSNYFDHNQIRDVAARTNANAVIVPENTHGAPGVETYFDLMNTWVTSLVQGFAGAPAR